MISIWAYVLFGAGWLGVVFVTTAFMKAHIRNYFSGSISELQNGIDKKIKQINDDLDNEVSYVRSRSDLNKYFQDEMLNKYMEAIKKLERKEFEFSHTRENWISDRIHNEVSLFTKKTIESIKQEFLFLDKYGTTKEAVAKKALGVDEIDGLVDVIMLDDDNIKIVLKDSVIIKKIKSEKTNIGKKHEKRK
jgi:hypothetical protein